MSLTQSAVSGAKWTATSSSLTAGLQLLQTAVLARLLEPEDFGLMAMVMVVIGLAQCYADMGVSNAIIHRQDITRQQLSSLYWLNILAGVVVFAAVLALAPLITLVYGEPRLSALVYLTALVFLAISPGQQFQILLEKHLRFKELAIIEVAAAVIGASVAISSAFRGLGVHALIYGLLSAAFTKTLVLMVIGWRNWRPTLHFSRHDLPGYLKFGLFQLGERTVNYFNQRLDQILIGALLGSQALGYYSVAYNLVYLPISRINPIFTRVAFPVFSRIQDDATNLRRGFMKMRGLLATVNFPLYLGIAAIAPVLVQVLFGEQWKASIPLVQILALVFLIRSMGNPVGSLLLAKGRADLGFYINCLLPVVLVPAIYLGAKLGGLEGVPIALLLVIAGLFWAGYCFLVRPLIGPCLNQYLGSLGPAALAAGLMAAAVYVIPHIVAQEGLALLFLQTLAGAGIYAGMYWFFFRDHAFEIFRLVAGRNAP